MDDAEKIDGLSLTMVIVLISLDIFVWWKIIFLKPAHKTDFYFLDVGQGDATLLTLDGIKILTDAGPTKKILQSLDRATDGDRYIDLAIISHQQLDHFNGFNYLLNNYRFGAILYNGRDESTNEWRALLSKINQQQIPLITMAAGDKITYLKKEIDIISPNNSFVQSGELNDTGIVELIKADGVKGLLAADIGFKVENYVAEHFDIAADILKVPHHGSKTSSSEKFLRAVSPKIAAIEVGADNRYGHPTKEALSRLEASGANVFRTDINGTIKVVVDKQKLKVFSDKQRINQEN